MSTTTSTTATNSTDSTTATHSAPVASLATVPQSILCDFVILIDTAEQQPFSFTGIRADSRYLSSKALREAAASGREFSLQVETRFLCLGRYPHSKGDYSIYGHAGQVGIERKGQGDAYSTFLGFSDGHRERFESELANLAEMPAASVVVECSWGRFFREAPEWGVRTKVENARTLHASIISWQQKFRVPFQFCDTRREAEIYTFRFLEMYWRKAKGGEL